MQTSSFAFLLAVSLLLLGQSVDQSEADAEALWDKLPGATDHNVQSASQKIVSPPRGIGGFWGKMVGSSSAEESPPQMERLSHVAPQSSTTSQRRSDVAASTQLMQTLAQLFKKKQKPHATLPLHRVQISSRPSANLTPTSIKRMGPLEVSPSSGGLADRMDLEEGTERLSAQVKAIQVLSTVRAMQDEIQDINQQIEAENKKMQTFTGENLNTKDDDLESELEQLAREIQIQNRQGSLLEDIQTTEEESTMRSEGSTDLGEALKQLAEKRQQIELTQKKIAEARLRQAQESLIEDQKIKQEKDQLIASIEGSKRDRVKTVKQRAQSKIRAAMLNRLQKVKATEAHKSLIEASNQRVVSKIEQLKDQRQRAAELKKKAAIQQQLAQLNAVKLLQQKKLAKLRKQNDNAAPAKLTSSSLATSSALSKLSPNEKLQMLSWLDLERNAEILAATDKKIKEKMKAKLTANKLVQKAAQQVLGDYEDYDYYDDLTDEEIDEILLTVGGGAGAGGIVGDDYDDLLDYYADDVDLTELLGDYDVDPVVPAVPLVPAAAPHPVPHPVPHPSPETPYHPYEHDPHHYHYQSHPVNGYNAPPVTHVHIAVEPKAPTPTPGPVEIHHHHPEPAWRDEPYNSYSPTPKPYGGSYQPPTEPYHPYTPEPHHHTTPRPHHHHYSKPTPHYYKPTPKPYHYAPEPHYHHQPKPSYHSKPTQKPYNVHYTTRPPYSPLPPGPPYHSHKPHHSTSDYDYEYYDSYDPPPAHYDSHKLNYHYSTTTPAPYINTFTSHPIPTHEAPYRTEEPYYYDDYQAPFSHASGHFDTSGHKFLEGVSAIFDGAQEGVLRPHEVGPILGSTLLQDIQHKVHSELNLGPEGQRFTKIVVGTTTPTPSVPPPFLPGFEPRVDINPRSTPPEKQPSSRPRRRRKRPQSDDGFATGSKSSQKKADAGGVTQKVKSPEPDGQLSFSALMSDFLLNKPLPFKAAQKTRHLGDDSPPHG